MSMENSRIIVTGKLKISVRKHVWGLNKEKFTRSVFEPMTSGLTCCCSIN